MEATRCFEALEGRALLSAPVAAVQSFVVAASTMHVVVSYTSDTGIDPASISRFNLGVTGPALARQAESATIVSQQPTQTIVRYVLRKDPPGDAYAPWANGTYNLGIPAGTVRSTDGVPIADTGVGSYWLWFPDRFVEVVSMYLNDDGLVLNVRAWNRNLHESVPASVRLTRPDGTEIVRSFAGIYTGVYGASFYLQNAGGRPWDYTLPRGTYTIALGDYNGAQLVGYHPAAQYWLWPSNPTVELVSTDVTESGARVVVRVRDDTGIDLSSFSWQNLGVNAGPGGEFVGPSMDGPYPSAPVVEPQTDGSVLATYWRAPAAGAFTNRESGPWSYYVPGYGYGPRDIDGNAATAILLGRETHVFTTIAAGFVGLTAHADDPTYLMLSVRFVTFNLDLGTFGDDDVRLELNGHTYALGLAYGANGGNFYTLRLPAGERLDAGTGRFYLNAGAVTTSGVPSAETFLGEFWFWFN